MDPAQPDNNKRKREDEVAVPAAPDAAPDYAKSLMAEQMKKMQDQMVAMQEALVNAQAETKKAKTESSSSSSQLPDEAVFPLDSTGRRKVKVRVYQGRLGIDIRDYYKKGDEWLPTKKGISLKPEEFDRLVTWIPKIQEAVLAKK